MRSLWLMGTGIVIAGMSGTAAEAQQPAAARGPGAGYSRPGAMPAPRAPMIRPVVDAPAADQTMVMRPAPNRWGSKVDGRWWGGANAPGGWNAYRRQSRGTALPSYWMAPRFTITDWRLYDLTAPVTGYRWVRYYDDAVMVDARGSVYDTVQGVAWDGAIPGASDTRVAYDTHDERVYERRERRSDGVGGAVAGAVVGGVAGNVIAGRGDRLGGTLIGAGVGAATGYAIDRAEDRRRREREYDVPVAPDREPWPEVGYGGYDGYHGYLGHAPYPHGPVTGAPGWTSPDGRTTVVTSGGGYPGSSVTTVTVQGAPATTTTTTTETWEEDGGYTRKPARKVMRRMSKH